MYVFEMMCWLVISSITLLIGMILYPDQNFQIPWWGISQGNTELLKNCKLTDLQYSLSYVDKKLIFRRGKLDQIQQLGGGVQSCISFVFGGHITRHCERILFFLYKNECCFCGRIPSHVVLKLFLYQLYFISGSDWCQKYCLYQDICAEWKLLGNIQHWCFMLMVY